MTDEQIAKVPGGVQLLPMTAGEIVLAYNLPGVKELRLSREVYPAIFLGKITKWNDPKIAAVNPGVKLPDLQITVVRRADSSGTTFVFTNHLSAISPEWKKDHGAGNSVNWPSSDKIVAAPKNDGVTATIKQTTGAIGYIEYGYAKLAKVPVALLQNKAGQYVRAGGEGGAQALVSAKLPADMRLWLPDPEGAKAYPIATYTWMLFYKKYEDPEKAAALRKMIEYCLTEGQKISTRWATSRCRRTSSRRSARPPRTSSSRRRAAPWQALHRRAIGVGLGSAERLDYFVDRASGCWPSPAPGCCCSCSPRSCGRSAARRCRASASTGWRS